MGQQEPDILRCGCSSGRTSQMQNRPSQPIPSVHIEIGGERLRLNRARFRPRSSPAFAGTRIRARGGVSSSLELALKRLLITLSKETMECVHARWSGSTDTSLTGGPRFPRTTPQTRLCLIDERMHSKRCTGGRSLSGGQERLKMKQLEVFRRSKGERMRKSCERG